jgi:hypothetical protein
MGIVRFALRFPHTRACATPSRYRQRPTADLESSRHPFTDPVIVGRFVFHCHAVDHEDKGMMGVVEVVER